MHYMSIEQLKRLKRGDQVFVRKQMATVVSKGHKWIRLDSERRPINLSTGRLQRNNFGCGDELPIYSTETCYQVHMQQLKEIRIVKGICQELSIPSVPLKPELIEDLKAVFKKHNTRQEQFK